MKKSAIFLSVLAIVALCAATSQAGLISLFTFDNTANDAVPGAPAGTLVGAATYATGVVGSGALSVANVENAGPGGLAYDYVSIGTGGLPIGGDAYGSNVGGMWQGSTTLWVKTTDTSIPTLLRERDDATAATHLVGLDWAQGTVDSTWGHFRLSTDGDNTLGASVNFGTTADNSWHMLVWTWNATTGDTGTGVVTGYIDGQPKAVIYGDGLNAITSDDTFSSAWTASSIGCGYNNGFNEPYHGLMDDVAEWNNVITDTEAKALYNLAMDTLDYNAADAAKLFDIYATGTSATVGGQTWVKVTSGLGTTAGAVIGSSALNLGGASGAGVQIQAAGPVTWTGASNTTWHNTANWNPSSSPDGVAVTFDNTATGTSANIASAATPTSVTFNASQSFSITGASFGIGGAATVLKQGTGTVTMSSANSYTGLTTQENGKLVLAGGAKTPVLSNAGINLKFGKLVLDYNDSGTSPAAIDTAMKASYAGGAWAGGKFQSTTATTANTLGWKADTINKLITVEYTLYGDANVDGSVNLSDLGFLGDNYGLTTGATWAMGDFNYDGKVNLSDLGFLGDQYGGHVAGFVTAGPANPAPEPGTLVLLAAASVGLGFYGGRRRKTSR